MSSGNVVRRAAVQNRRASLPQVEVSGAFHSIKSVDNLISVENRYEAVHRLATVDTGPYVFPKDAPAIFQSPQYSS
jgi:hypothetical protein